MVSYRLGVFELKQQDVHALALGEQHVPQPIIHSQYYFNLPLTSTIRFVCSIVLIASSYAIILDSCG
jgi:hypothetical protein